MPISITCFVFNLSRKLLTRALLIYKQNNASSNSEIILKRSYFYYFTQAGKCLANPNDNSRFGNHPVLAITVCNKDNCMTQACANACASPNKTIAIGHITHGKPEKKDLLENSDLLALTETTNLITYNTHSALPITGLQNDLSLMPFLENNEIVQKVIVSNTSAAKANLNPEESLPDDKK